MAKFRRKAAGPLGPGDRMVLELGFNVTGINDTFENKTELRAGWLANRETIMREWDRPGERPAAWWEFEARVEVPVRRASDVFAGEWFQQADLLLDRGMLGAEEQERMELRFPELSGNLKASVNPSAAQQEATTLPPHMLRVAAARAEFAARWHDRRGRPELAARQTELQAIYQNELKGTRNET